MRTRRPAVLAICVWTFLSLASVTTAQTVQVIRGTDRVLTAEAEARLDSNAINIASALGSYRSCLDTVRSEGAGASMALFELAIDRGERALDLTLSAEERLRSLEMFVRAQQELIAVRTPTECVMQASNVAAVPPALYKLIPDLVFAAGVDVVTGSDGVASLALGTNLLGAVAGTAFDALGSKPLKDYFLDNIVVGTAIPLRRAKLSTEIGLGLGGLHFLGASFWPALHLEELDTADTRLPSDIRRLESSSWSTPIIAIGVPLIPLSSICNHAKTGKPIPVLTVGYKAPFFYPGGVFDGLAALFTSSRSKFVREGRGALRVGVAVPILKPKPDPGLKC